MHKYIKILLLLSLSSCCKEGEELERFLLSAKEKTSVPYKTNDLISFTHTNGFDFNLTVSNRQSEMKETETDDCKSGFSSYESLNINLFSTIPEFFIDIELVPEDYNPFLSISVNSYYFDLDLTSAPDLDTLLLNEKKYPDVYILESFVTDSLVIAPNQVLYNKKNGIIKIIMTNNEEFTINQ